MRLALLAPTVLALAGCTSAEGLVDRLVGSPAPQTASGYVALAQAANRFEIESARLALSRAQRPEVRALAQRLLDEHGWAAAQLAQASASVGQSLPDDPLTGTQRQRLAALESAAPDAFDALFLHQLVPVHDEAMRLHHAYALSGDEWALRHVAASAVGKAFQHRDEARRALRSEREAAFDRIGWVDPR